MKRKLMLLLVCLFVSIGFVTAQTSTVSGVVTSEEDGEPVVGASVLVQGTTLGTVTDIDGKFTIPGVPSSAKTLRVSFVGMQQQEVPIKQGLMKITLKPDTEVLDEVVVTAMGISRSEKTLGYSATTVKSDEIISARTTNVANALSGKVAGLQVSSTSSDPGSVSNIVIRGFSSINGNNQPLYVVDGVPLQNNMFSGSGKNVATGGIANVSSEDIESMTVLKGAAATALYGSRAANVSSSLLQRPERREMAGTSPSAIMEACRHVRSLCCPKCRTSSDKDGTAARHSSRMAPGGLPLTVLCRYMARSGIISN